jgi:hypothetical protein
MVVAAGLFILYRETRMQKPRTASASD